MPIGFSWSLSGTPDPAVSSEPSLGPYKAVRLTEAGDIDLTGGKATLVGGGEAVAGRLRQRLERVKGEWFFDRNKGLPWFDEIFTKGPLVLTIQTLITREILETPEITALETMTLDIDTQRRLFVDFVATMQAAGTLSIRSLLGG